MIRFGDESMSSIQTGSERSTQQAFCRRQERPIDFFPTVPPPKQSAAGKDCVATITR